MSLFSACDFLNNKIENLNYEWSKQEIDDFVKLVVENKITDAQIAAFLMLVRLKGLSFAETASLTFSKAKYSHVFKWEHKTWGKWTVDKHSTGGIGDKTSQIMAPILAACGLKIPMISGRGLGVTGGTLDKLGAINGYSCQLTKDKVESLLDSAGFCIMGQTDEIVPADRRLYQIRDTTATVSSLPLVTASILSKKLCEGINTLILDVKVGRGMFTNSIEEAEKLSHLMIDVAKLLNLKMTCLLTDMNRPLGYCVGNALEMAEVFNFLNGGHNDLQLERLVFRLCSELLIQSGLVKHENEALKMCKKKIEDGSAGSCMSLMLQGHGVSKDLADKLCTKTSNSSIAHYISLMKQESKYKRDLKSNISGYINHIEAYDVGIVTWRLGSGRAKPEDPIDYTVGVEIKKQVGESVQKDDTLATIYYNDESILEKNWHIIHSAFKIESIKLKIEDTIIKHII